MSAEAEVLLYETLLRKAIGNKLPQTDKWISSKVNTFKQREEALAPGYPETTTRHTLYVAHNGDFLKVSSACQEMFPCSHHLGGSSLAIERWFITHNLEPPSHFKDVNNKHAQMLKYWNN